MQNCCLRYEASLLFSVSQFQRDLLSEKLNVFDSLPNHSILRNNINFTDQALDYQKGQATSQHRNT